MQSILRSERRRNTKKRRLGKVEILHHEAYTALDLEVKVEMIRSLVPLGPDARPGVIGRGDRCARQRLVSPQGRGDTGPAPRQ